MIISLNSTRIKAEFRIEIQDVSTLHYSRFALKVRAQIHFETRKAKKNEFRIEKGVPKGFLIKQQFVKFESYQPILRPIYRPILIPKDMSFFLFSPIYWLIRRLLKRCRFVG